MRALVRLARRLAGALLLALVAGAASAATYTYDVNAYNTYVSNGSWWTKAAMTNNTLNWVSWKVTFKTESCREYSGSVSLAIEARLTSTRKSCWTTTREMTTAIAPRSSAALLERAVAHYVYYLIRKIERETGREVASGYTTQKDSFSDHAFSSQY
jgi:hypothetical protein